MSSKTTRVKTIRIKNETADFFEGKPLNKVVESVHTLAINKEVEIQTDGNIRLSDNNDKRENNPI